MYAMYLRKSRADIEAEALGEMETLARHQKILTELAKRQGLVVSKIYKEIVSGESITDRPEMQRLLEDGTYSRAEFVERKDAISAKIENLKSAISALEESTPVNDYDEKIVKYTEVIASLKNPDVDAKSKNDLLKGIFEKIEYSCEDLGRQKGGNVTLDLFLA